MTFLVSCLSRVREVAEPQRKATAPVKSEQVRGEVEEREDGRRDPGRENRSASEWVLSVGVILCCWQVKR